MQTIDLGCDVAKERSNTIADQGQGLFSRKGFKKITIRIQICSWGIDYSSSECFNILKPLDTFGCCNQTSYDHWSSRVKRVRLRSVGNPSVQNLLKRVLTRLPLVRSQNAQEICVSKRYGRRYHLSKFRNFRFRLTADVYHGVSMRKSKDHHVFALI